MASNLTLWSRRAQMAAIAARERRSASLRHVRSGARLHTSGPNERAAAAPNLTRQASPKFAAMVLQNAKQVLERHKCHDMPGMPEATCLCFSLSWRMKSGNSGLWSW